MQNKTIKPNRVPMPEHGKLGLCCYCGGTFSPSKTTMYQGGVELCKDCAKEYQVDEGEVG